MQRFIVSVLFCFLFMGSLAAFAQKVHYNDKYYTLVNHKIFHRGYNVYGQLSNGEIDTIYMIAKELYNDNGKLKPKYKKRKGSDKYKLPQGYWEERAKEEEAKNTIVVAKTSEVQTNTNHVQEVSSAEEIAVKETSSEEKQADATANPVKDNKTASNTSSSYTKEKEEAEQALERQVKEKENAQKAITSKEKEVSEIQENAQKTVARKEEAVERAEKEVQKAEKKVEKQRKETEKAQDALEKEQRKTEKALEKKASKEAKEPKAKKTGKDADQTMHQKEKSERKVEEEAKRERKHQQTTHKTERSLEKAQDQVDETTRKLEKTEKKLEKQEKELRKEEKSISKAEKKLKEQEKLLEKKEKAIDALLATETLSEVSKNRLETIYFKINKEKTVRGPFGTVKLFFDLINNSDRELVILNPFNAPDNRIDFFSTTMECEDIPVLETAHEPQHIKTLDTDFVTIAPNTLHEFVINGQFQDYLACNSNEIVIKIMYNPFKRAEEGSYYTPEEQKDYNKVLKRITPVKIESENIKFNLNKQ